MLFKLEMNRDAEPTSQLFLCIKGIDQIKTEEVVAQDKKFSIVQENRQRFVYIGGNSI